MTGIRTGLPYRAALAATIAVAAVASFAASPLRSSYADENGGWGVIEAPREYIPEAEQEAVWQTIERNVAVLQAQGKLPRAKAATSVKFGWPTRFAQGRPELFDHVISNYIDQDPAVDSVRDYNCGTRTYDTSSVGGGHKGTDIGIGLRSFYKMDTEQVVVVAAADGVIVSKDDTNPDRSCGDLTVLFANNTLRNNVISIHHADGTTTIYYHVKTGSLTPKKVGDAVVEGEYLGAVGSAGFSTGPHLHFEVRSATNAVIDPWQGTCNPGIGESLWKAQEPYHFPQVLSLMPTSTAPTAANTTTNCTNNVADSETAADYVQPDLYAQPGVTHYFVAFIRDIESGGQVVFALKRPDGSQYSSFTFTASAYSANSYAFISRTIAAAEPAGKWSFQVTFAGVVKSLPFYFNVPAPATARVYEFFNQALNHYFRTAAPAEAASLTPASGFLPTGDDFMALDRTVSLAGVMQVCRFYGSPDPGPNSHFYTADPAECQALKNIQASTPATQPRWNFEENAFAAYLPVNGGCPVEAPFPIYRLYNGHHGETLSGIRQDSNHRFTSLSSIYYQLAALGWNQEGVVMCAGSRP